MNDDELKAIEDYAATLHNVIFAADVQRLVAEVRRLREIATRLLPFAELALGSADFKNDAPGQFEPCNDAVRDATQILRLTSAPAPPAPPRP